MHAIQEYTEKVISGDIIVSKKMMLQIERVQRLLKNPNYYYDVKAGDRPSKFSEKFCKHYKGDFVGKPVKYELWQRYIVAVIYGLKYKETNTRVTQEAGIVIARKNGKTTLAASLALYQLTKDFEAFPEVYSIGTKRDQAALLYKDVQKMVQFSPDLTKVIHKTKTELEYLRDSGGLLKPLSSDASTLDGLNVSAAIFDELHAYKDQEIIDVIQSSQGARKQPLMIFITTNGTTRDKVFDDRYNYYENILNGIVEDDTVQPFIFEMDDEQEIYDENLWVKANPNLGVSVSISWLRKQVKKLQDDPVQKVGILTKNFNIPQTATVVFFSSEACKVNPYDESLLAGTYGFLGIDLSYTKDLSVITYITRTEDNKLLTKRWYLIPEELRVTKNLQDKKDYTIYNQVRYIKGKEINEQLVIDEVTKIVEEEEIIVLKMGVDPYRAGVVIEYFRYKVDKDYVKAINNKYKTSLTPTIYSLRDGLDSKSIYFNDELFSHHLGSTVAKIDKNEEILLEKLLSTLKIDAVYSTIYALKAEHYYKQEAYAI